MDVALGGDIMTVALRGYAQFKRNGRAAGPESLRRDLGHGFGKSARKKPDRESEAV